MTKREQQAFQDGREAYARDQDLTSCRRYRTPGQTHAFQHGWEHERRQQAGAKMTPDQIAEAEANLATLKAFARTL